MSEKNEVDVNEAFGNILLAEDLAEESGYEEGYEVGRSQLLNGYHLGYHRGSLLAAQLGFYKGVLEQFMASKGSDLPEKLLLQGNKLQEEILNFPKSNDSSVDLFKALEDIKFRYNKFCSLAKAKFAYPEAEKLEF